MTGDVWKLTWTPLLLSVGYRVLLSLLLWLLEGGRRS